jgi:phage FluMu gp28-like protein
LPSLKKDVTTFEIEFAEGGRLMAVPSGEDKIRLYHPTLYVMDEAAFLPEAQQCYDAAEPVAHQIIAISSAGPGWFGLQCSR